MTRLRPVAMLLVCLVAGCGRTMCDIPDVNSSEVGVGFHIKDYGPRHAVAGAAFNAQPDGSSAAWFRLDQDVSGSEIKVHFGDEVVSGNIARDLVTAKVPDGAHARPGNLRVMIERRDGLDVSKSNSVVITLEKP